MIMIKFARRLRELREERGLKRGQLAKRIHTTYYSLWSWENGRTRPGFEELALLAEIFQTTTDYLIGASDERSRK